MTMTLKGRAFPSQSRMIGVVSLLMRCYAPCKTWARATKHMASLQAAWVVRRGMPQSHVKVTCVTKLHSA